MRSRLPSLVIAFTVYELCTRPASLRAGVRKVAHSKKVAEKGKATGDIFVSILAS